MKAEHIVATATAALLGLMGAGSLMALPAGKPQAAQSVSVSEELIIPVAGVRAAELADSWGQPRSGGRQHHGIDSFAAQGTEVKATAPGKIVKLYLSKRGGITIYQASSDGAFIFYYAHLNGYASDLKEGMTVEQGRVIGYVGQTGNAPVPHLHFEVQTANAAGDWSKGEAMNPYPLLKAGKVEIAAAASMTGAAP